MIFSNNNLKKSMTNHFDTTALEIFSGSLMEIMRILQKRFWWNTTNIETGTTQGGTLFDTNRLETELCSLFYVYLFIFCFIKFLQSHQKTSKQKIKKKYINIPWWQRRNRLVQHQQRSNQHQKRPNDLKSDPIVQIEAFSLSRNLKNRNYKTSSL